MDKPGKHYLESERQLIHLMLKNRDVVDEVLSSGVSPDFFDPHHQRLVESIYKEFINSDRKRLLTRVSYRQMLLESGAGGDMMQNLTVYDKCFIGVYAKVDDLGYLKKLLVEGYMARECFFYFQDFRKESDKKGFLYAANNLHDKLKSALGTTDSGRSVLTSISEIRDEYIKDLEYRRDNMDKVVRCGIPEIDNIVNVGFRPQHLTLFVADVGSHKTNMMLNIALNLYDRKHSVLFIPLEMGRLDLTNRIIANRASINYNKLACPEMLSNEEWDRIRNCKVWLDDNHRFCILDADDRTSVSQLQHEIEKRSMVFHPDVIIIDYIANLKPDRRFGDRNDLEIGEILKSLRFLGKKHKFHIISAAQMGRAAIKALRDDTSAVPDSTSIRGSHEYSADSDTIFGLLKLPDENDKIKVINIKARHGPSGGHSELRVYPEYCRIVSGNSMLIGDDSDDLSVENEINESPDNISAHFDHLDFDDIG